MFSSISWLAAVSTIVLFIQGAHASPAAFIVEKASLRVLSPASQVGQYDTALANFGTPLYGASLLGELVYSADNALGCTPYADLPRAKGVGHATIALVDRGSCYFAEKVLHAQLAGAQAVLVADDVDEPLLTMADPDGSAGGGTELARLAQEISIPSALVTKKVGDALRAATVAGDTLVLTLDWKDSISHPDDRVEWELWSSSDQVCGDSCTRTQGFIRDIMSSAVDLEEQGSASFSPHYVTWSCPIAANDSEKCGGLCINEGRYCAPDPTDGQDVDPIVADKVRAHGYNGSDVVTENLRRLCLFKELTGDHHGNVPWKGGAPWWKYATTHPVKCSMADGTFTAACSEAVMSAGAPDGCGLDTDAMGRISQCVGDTSADKVNPLMDAEMQLQSDQGDSGRGAIVMLPTVVVNLDQYRGRLTSRDVLRAICAGFLESTEPRVCLSSALQSNECLRPDHGGCWFKETPGGANFSACVDTFRGVECRCPSSFHGDGVVCDPVEECSDPAMNRCEQECVNVLGGHRCECRSGFKLVGGTSCLQDPVEMSKLRSIDAGSIFGISLLVLLGVTALGYAAYRIRIKGEIDREVRALMAEYMPLNDEAVNDTSPPRGRVNGANGGIETELRTVRGERKVSFYDDEV